MFTPTSFLLFLTAGHFALASDFSVTLHQGQEALARADYPAAEHFFLTACEAQSSVSFTPDVQASCEHHLAIVAELRGNYSLAAARLARTLALWTQAGPRFRPSWVMSSLNLGEVFREQGRLEDADRYLHDGASVAKTVQADYPQLYPQALSRIAGLQAESGAPETARPLLTEAISAFRQLAPGQSVELARAMNTLGIVDLLANHMPQAQLNLEQAVTLSLAASGPDHPVTAGYQSDLALVFLQSRQYSRAEPLLKRALFILRSGALPNQLRLAIILAELSVVECSRNKLALAEEYANQAGATLADRPGLNTAASLVARATLGYAWLQQHRAEEAERILPPTVAEERRVAPDTFLLADGLRQLAALRMAQHCWKEAAALYREAIEIYERRSGRESAALATLLVEYADILRRGGGSREEVKKLEMAAKQMRTTDFAR